MGKSYRKSYEVDQLKHSYSVDDGTKENYEITIKPPQLYDSIFGGTRQIDQEENYSISPNKNSNLSHSNKQCEREATKFTKYRLKTVFNYVEILKGQVKELTREITQLQAENQRNISYF